MKKKTRSRSRDSTLDPFSYSLRLINIRGRTEHELRSRLLEKGFDSSVVDRVIERLKDIELIDDERILNEIVEYGRRIKRLGRYGLRQFCLKRGLPKELVDNIPLEEIDEEAMAEELVKNRLPQMEGLPWEKKRRRLYGLLSRRGYSSETIWNVLNRVVPESEKSN
jgi:regulatory protein